VSIETPDGSSLAATDHALRFVEGRLDEMPEVKSHFANLGHGNPQVFYNHIPRQDAANYAEIFVQLRSYDTRRTPERLDQLRKALAEYPNARIFVDEFINGPPITAPIAVRILGPDLDKLEELSRTVESLLARVPGTRDIDNPLRVARTNLRLKVDSQKANLLGVSTGSSTARYACRSPDSRPAATRKPTANSTTSWCARRSGRALTLTHSARCASRA
jgi:multidrug efflux pump subunit AcrB